MGECPLATAFVLVLDRDLRHAVILNGEMTEGTLQREERAEQNSKPGCQQESLVIDCSQSAGGRRLTRFLLDVYGKVVSW